MKHLLKLSALTPAELTRILDVADQLKAQQAAPVEGAEEIEALIAKRLEAKRAKNWAEADAIRDQLRAMGVEIKDGKDGTTWTRI